MAEPRRAAARPALRIEGGRFLIVEARFYDAIGDHLLVGARRAFEAAGAVCDVVSVDGALEVPPGMAIALDAAEAEGHAYDGAIALGCVVRGETYHFEIVAGESARALMDMSVERKLALGNGILTTDTIAQADERADPQRGDKGGDAARAAIGLALLNAEWARDEEVRSSLRRAPRRLAGALPDGSRREGAERHPGGIRGLWIGKEIEGDAYNPAELAFFRDVVSGVLRDQTPIDRGIDERSPRAGRCAGSRRSCGRSCAPPITNCAPAGRSRAGRR